VVKFFIPGISDADEAECRWEEWRVMLGASAEPGRRLYSVRFMHNGNLCPATVGKRVMVAKPKTNGGSVRLGMPRATGATVVAIFRGPPFVVLQARDEPTKWANPFMVGESTIQYTEEFA
jgi:hypothetical protein